MDVFNPNNDQIDKYLRGELQGAELDQFIRGIESDAELKKEIEFRKLLVDGIRQHGSIQLKNYIKQRTSHKKGMRITFKTWYYAAAAVGIILIGSIALLMQKSPQNTVNIAQTDTLFPAPPTNSEKAKNESEIIAKNEDNKRKETADTDEPPAMETEPWSDEKDVDFPANVVVIASNIPIIPIKIESTIPASEMMSKKTGTLPSKGTETTPQDSKKIDSALASAKGAFSTTENYVDEVARFKLNFYNTNDARPGIVVSKLDKTTNQAEVTVYNIPYTNPLIVEFQNQYYLKTGETYYQIQMNQTTMQTPVKVTDTNVLKALNK